MHRTLITGGAGFLGSHLCDYLLNKDHEVICMDNLLTGSLSNIKHIKNDRFNFIEHNVTNFINIDGLGIELTASTAFLITLVNACVI